MLESGEHSGELVVRVPSFSQCMKLGAGFALGAVVVAFVSTVFWMLFSAGAITAIGLLSLGTRAATAPTPAPVVRRAAPTSSLEFEQRVQRIQRERAEGTEEGRAFGEALRREQASRGQLAK